RIQVRTAETLKSPDPVERQEREQAHETPHGGVLGVAPVLVVVVRTGPRGIEPDGIALRLAQLLARHRRDQRCRERERLATRRATDQIAAGQDVEPLVVAADLQDAADLSTI